MRSPAARPARNWCTVAWVLAVVQVVCGQVFDEAGLVDRPISEVRIDRVVRVDEGLVRNQLRSAVGDPYDPLVVKQDVARLTRLGEFQSVTAMTFS